MQETSFRVLQSKSFKIGFRLLNFFLLFRFSLQPMISSFLRAVSFWRTKRGKSREKKKKTMTRDSSIFLFLFSLHFISLFLRHYAKHKLIFLSLCLLTVMFSWSFSPSFSLSLFTTCSCYIEVSILCLSLHLSCFVVFLFAIIKWQ
jgi:hypothetical protein